MKNKNKIRPAPLQGKRCMEINNKPTKGLTRKEANQLYFPKLVYCENCKYLKDNYNRFYYKSFVYFCYAPSNLLQSKDFLRGDNVPNKKPQILNKNNNCKYYKRKWYKFWVK